MQKRYATNIANIIILGHANGQYIHIFLCLFSSNKICSEATSPINPLVRRATHLLNSLVGSFKLLKISRYFTRKV